MFANTATATAVNINNNAQPGIGNPPPPDGPITAEPASSHVEAQYAT